MVNLWLGAEMHGRTGASNRSELVVGASPRTGRRRKGPWHLAEPIVSGAGITNVWLNARLRAFPCATFLRPSDQPRIDLIFSGSTCNSTLPQSRHATALNETQSERTILENGIFTLKLASSTRPPTRLNEPQFRQGTVVDCIMRCAGYSFLG